MEIPTRKTKVGKMRSVAVHPFQTACRNCEYACSSSPLLFTRIMKAIVMPRITSSETRRVDLVSNLCGAIVADDIISSYCTSGEKVPGNCPPYDKLPALEASPPMNYPG